ARRDGPRADARRSSGSQDPQGLADGPPASAQGARAAGPSARRSVRRAQNRSARRRQRGARSAVQADGRDDGDEPEGCDGGRAMKDPIDVHLLDETVEFSLADLCRICGGHERLVVDTVEEGFVEPRGEVGEWRFTGIAVTRVQRVLRLQDEFEVNLAGAALALE